MHHAFKIFGAIWLFNHPMMRYRFFLVNSLYASWAVSLSDHKIVFWRANVSRPQKYEMMKIIKKLVVSLPSICFDRRVFSFLLVFTIFTNQNKCEKKLLQDIFLCKLITRSFTIQKILLASFIFAVFIVVWLKITDVLLLNWTICSFGAIY